MPLLSTFGAASARSLGGIGAAAGSLSIGDLFSTDIWTGDGSSSRAITNGLNLSGEGGLVWIKSRSSGKHLWFDTARGTGKYIQSNTTVAQSNASNTLSSFNSDGFTIGANADVNSNGTNYVAWSFRKAPGFFDVVQYSGTGGSQTVSHNLGVVPGMMIIRNYGISENWAVFHQFGGYHTNEGKGKIGLLNSANQFGTNDWWGNTNPTTTAFTVNSDRAVNDSGGNYIAYLFATATAANPDIGIRFGTTYNYNVMNNIGVTPQWVMVKRHDASGNWFIADSVRGVYPDGQGNDKILNANETNAEDSDDKIDFTDGSSTKGFRHRFFTGNGIYMAINAES